MTSSQGNYTAHQLCFGLAGPHCELNMMFSWLEALYWYLSWARARILDTVANLATHFQKL